MADKTYTIKGLQSEMTRLNNSIDSKKEQVKKLNESIKSETKRLKECQAEYKKLSNEQIQKRIAASWFKDDSMSKEQIDKLLAVSEKIKDKIDVLDVDTIVNAVTNAYEEHSATNENEVETKSESISGSDEK